MITEPNTTVSEQFWVWSDFQRLAYLCVFQTYYLEEDIPKSPRRLLVVDYDEGDVLDLVLAHPPATSTRRDPPLDPYRVLVSGGDIGDEFTLGETAGLASLAPTEPSSGMASTSRSSPTPVTRTGGSRSSPSTGSRREARGDGGGEGRQRVGANYLQTRTF